MPFVSKHAVRKWGLRVGALIVFAFFLGGCVGSPKRASAPIDPPPLDTVAVKGEDTGRMGDAVDDVARSESGAAESKATMTQKVLYVIDAHGYVVPLTVKIPYADGIAKQVLSYMVAGGPGETLIPTGFRLPIPAGTKVDVDVREDHRAVVDFSKAFASYDPGDELKIMQAVIWALTEFPTIERVELRLNGQPLSAMPVQGTPLPASLTRAIGLNVELSPEAVPGQTSAVMLYFEAESADGTFRYFVPVTRLIPRTADIATAAVTELIKGPHPGSPLVATVMPNAEVHRVQVEGERVMADVSADLLGPEPKRTALRAALAAALTLLSSTKAQGVQLLINGKPIKVGEMLDLTQPVSKPKSINPLVF
ncbi:MAG: GerMN domain-containing protein [Hydrogenibacillus sp.]|nr:GerMN domain-containing protein [Hydrogenibacillus sp.]